MSSLPEPHHPLPALGMTSLVLGVIALFVAFLSVLGVPISALGLLCGVVGLAAAFFGGASLRWSLQGIAVCALALAVNVALTFASVGYLPGRKVPRTWEPVPDRPYVPPPARPTWSDGGE
jgi:hypothetical protein